MSLSRYKSLLQMLLREGEGNAAHIVTVRCPTKGDCHYDFTARDSQHSPLTTQHTRLCAEIDMRDARRCVDNKGLKS